MGVLLFDGLIEFGAGFDLKSSLAMWIGRLGPTASCIFRIA
jgi:hypothetical protein